MVATAPPAAAWAAAPTRPGKPTGAPRLLFGVALTRLRVPVPLPSPWFWAIAALYSLLGLAGHDPWKQDDAIGFGIAWSMANGGLIEWLIPNVAGRMVPEEGPLAFWLAALLIKLLGGWLYAPDAARLSAGVWTMLSIYAVYRAARAQFGEADARLAVLALLACLGLLARTHETAAEPALVAASALLLWALAAASAIQSAPAPRDAFRLAVAIGGAIGMAALARGLPAALVLCAAVAALAVFDAAWRTPHRLLVLGGALVFALFLFALWTRMLIAYGGKDGALFVSYYADWSRAQFGVPAFSGMRYTAKTLAWFVFPVWPVALWWLARQPKRFLGDAEPRRLHLPALALGVATLASLGWTASATEAHLLPLIPAAAVFAAPACARLTRGMAAAIDWFGRITFTAAAALIWLGYCALQLDWPPRIAANFARLQPGFHGGFALLPFLIAVAATLAWIFVCARSDRTPLRAITHWCYGVLLNWLLLMTLLLPWIDYGKSYRSVAIGLKGALGATLADTTCLEARAVGLAERAALHYFLDLPFGTRCAWILQQGHPSDPRNSPPGTRLVWEGMRPGDRNERFRLYQR